MVPLKLGMFLRQGKLYELQGLNKISTANELSTDDILSPKHLIIEF